MKIGLLGDTHGDLGWMIYAIGKFEREGVDTVVQLGDFGIWPGTRSQLDFDRISEALVKANQEWYVIPGNHEDYVQIKHIPVMDSGFQRFRENIWLAPRGHSWEWGGLDFLAFGGAGSPDKSTRRENISWWVDEQQNMAELKRAHDVGQVDVMLSHDAPHGIKAVEEHISGPSMFRQVDLDYCDVVRWNTTNVFTSANPLFLFHGHFHFAYQEQVGTTLVTGLSLNNDRQGSLGSFDLATGDVRLWNLDEDFYEHYGRW